mmetsp:Transcript_33605/g.51752  ORF Transcript_33605/g.51752 Transcript_33605/m.51752 type:complete len:436 (-) Transcript_33605:1126-2433(-)
MDVILLAHQVVDLRSLELERVAAFLFSVRVLCGQHLLRVLLKDARRELLLLVHHIGDLLLRTLQEFVDLALSLVLDRVVSSLDPARVHGVVASEGTVLSDLHSRLRTGGARAWRPDFSMVALLFVLYILTLDDFNIILLFVVLEIDQVVEASVPGLLSSAFVVVAFSSSLHLVMRVNEVDDVSLVILSLEALLRLLLLRWLLLRLLLLFLLLLLPPSRIASRTVFSLLLLELLDLVLVLVEILVVRPHNGVLLRGLYIWVGRLLPTMVEGAGLLLLLREVALGFGVEVMVLILDVDLIAVVSRVTVVREPRGLLLPPLALLGLSIADLHVLIKVSLHEVLPLGRLVAHDLIVIDALELLLLRTSSQRLAPRDRSFRLLFLGVFHVLEGFLDLLRFQLDRRSLAEGAVRLEVFDLFEFHESIGVRAEVADHVLLEE